MWWFSDVENHEFVKTERLRNPRGRRSLQLLQNVTDHNLDLPKLLESNDELDSDIEAEGTTERSVKKGLNRLPIPDMVFH